MSLAISVPRHCFLRCEVMEQVSNLADTAKGILADAVYIMAVRVKNIYQLSRSDQGHKKNVFITKRLHSLLGPERK